MTRTVLLGFAGALALNSAALAALPAGVTISTDNRIVRVEHGVTAHTAAPPQNAKRTVIFDNLATLDPLGVYMDGTGYTLAGPNSGFGQIWLAAAFTPAASATLSEVQVAVGYVEGSKQAVLISVYSDASGEPGKLLWSQRAKIPTFGDCCAVASAHDGAGLALTAGTQYWVAVTTLSDATDTFGAWCFNVADQIDPGQTAVNMGSGWKASPSVPTVAFAVFGN